MDNQKAKIILVSGNIGVGKTSLINSLCEYYNSQGKTCYPIYEATEDRLLYEFGASPKDWAFKLQLSLLGKELDRMVHVTRHLEEECLIFLDRCVIDQQKAFIPSLRDHKLLTTEQLDTCDSLSYEIRDIMENLFKIDCLLYVTNKDFDRLKERIVKRNRPYEKDLSKTYLKSLEEHYQRKIASRYKFFTGRMVQVDTTHQSPSETLQDAIHYLDY